MITIKDVFEDYRKQINGVYDANEIEAITLLAISEITGMSNASIKAFPERVLSEEQAESANNVVAELKTGKPIQYIFGITEFYGLPFKVNRYVLIPRPETEELVEWVLSTVGNRQFAVDSDQLKMQILDIGTGSGCIAISLKKNLSEANVSAIDISKGALETAKGNAELNNVEVNFIEADILSIKSEIQIPKSDIIVSNPPYVTLEDKKQMHTNVTDFEPHTALFVPEHDPLLFYRAIAEFALDNLNPEGQLFFEINEGFGKETVQLLTDKDFKNIELRKDMSGRDRMIRCLIS
ncbi:peptide chain release factor N(5)-glutamine methyltransferase [Mucilaginibacter sp. CAU 1740]|uniref:peptide chain release factor N(5)-glutamine methyltransferase n=1 Tax=Mucilaginibacter sp. CAU 1740 TaxID=3140365 RepID=UPI00325A4CC1